LSYALRLNGSYHVLCSDLDFGALAGDDYAFGITRGTQEQRMGSIPSNVV